MIKRIAFYGTIALVIFLIAFRPDNARDVAVALWGTVASAATGAWETVTGG